MKPTARLSSFLILAGSSLFAISAASAQSTWIPTVAGTTYDWQTIGNWTSGVPSGAGVTANLNNNIAGAQQISLNGAVILGTLNYSDNNSSNSFTLNNGTGGSLTFNNNGSGALITETGGNNVTDTINATITLADNLTTNVAGLLSITGAIGETGGARSLTKSGAGELRLTGTSNYSGGVVINGGQLTATSGNAALGGSGRDVTFTGTSTLRYNLTTNAGFAIGTLTINSEVSATINKSGTYNGAVAYTFSTTTGAGTLRAVTDWGDTYNLGDASAFTGNILIQSTSGAASHALNFQRLNDAVGSSIQFAGTAANAATTQTVALTSDIGPLTFNNRQVQITSMGRAGQPYTPTLANNNATAANKWVINTALSYTGVADTAAKSLGLAGSNTGDNEFAGLISNGTGGGTLGLIKSGAGKWIISGSNTYTGATTVNAGILEVRGTLGHVSAGVGNYAGTVSITNTSSGRLVYNSTAAQTLGGVISGTGALFVEQGTLALTNTNTYAGATTINGGILAASVLANGGSNSSIGASNNAATNLVFGAPTATMRYTGSSDVTTNRSFTMSSGASGGATIESSGSGTLSFDNTVAIAYGTTNETRALTLGGTNTGTNTFGKVIANNGTSGATSLVKNGAGTWVLSQTNTYGGSTTVNNGLLNVTSGSINNSSGVTVNGGEFRYGSSTGLTTNVTINSGGTFRYNSSTAYTGGTITNNGGSIGGSGDIGVAMTFNSTSDILAPGNSPGIQEYTVGQTWASFTYQWEVNDFDGTTAGTDFDQIQISNTLTLTGATVGSYILDLVSLAGLTNVAGNVADFSETTTSWTILTTSGGITGFNDGYWTIDTGGPNAFTSSPTWSGNWSLSLNNTNDSIILTYTPIPEPRAALLGGIGMLLLLRRRRD